MNTPNACNPWIMPLGSVVVIAPTGTVTLQGLLPTDIAIPTEAGRTVVNANK